LSAAFLDGEAHRIDPQRAAPWPSSWSEGDTVWMGAADSSGLVVSYIQSIFWNSVQAACCRTPAPDAKSWCQLFRWMATQPTAGAGTLPFHTLNPALAG